MCHSSTRPGTSHYVTQFYQVFPHVTASNKRWGEKAWVRGYPFNITPWFHWWPFFTHYWLHFCYSCKWQCFDHFRRYELPNKLLTSWDHSCMVPWRQLQCMIMINTLIHTRTHSGDPAQIYHCYICSINCMSSLHQPQSEGEDPAVVWTDVCTGLWGWPTFAAGWVQEGPTDQWGM